MQLEHSVTFWDAGMLALCILTKSEPVWKIGDIDIRQM